MANSKDALSKLEAAQLMRAAGMTDEQIRTCLAAKGGPKGADMDPGMIYYQPAEHTNSGLEEIFLSFHSKPWGRDTTYNGATCLTATARDPELVSVAAAKACGVSNIRSASLGTPMLTLAELNELILEEIHTRLAEKEAQEDLAAQDF